MMHKAWSSIEELHYCFSRSSVKFQGQRGQKNIDFDPNWVFPDCNSSFNSLMVMKWCTKLEATWNRCPIVFQGHLLNIQVTRDEKSKILTRIECFRTLTAAWIHPWLWNDAQTLVYCRRGVLLFFKVIHQISRSYKPWCTVEEVSCCFSRSSIKFQGHTKQKKPIDFDPNWAFPDCNSSLNSPMAWCSTAEVPYCFPRSSIKFQGHTGQKIANFDPNWGFPDCNSSFPPMDLKWWTKPDVV